MKKSDVRARKITKGFTYPLPDSSSETERLIQQSAFINPFTRALFMEAGIAPSMSVLDVGSGAGDVALLAADLVGSEGRVVGVDRNGAGLGVARARAKAAGFSHVTFREGNLDIGLDEKFDAVVGRLVLMYQPTQPPHFDGWLLISNPVALSPLANTTSRRTPCAPPQTCRSQESSSVG